MKAAVVNTLGQPPQYQEFADPIVGENEVLVHVSAAGLHPLVRSVAAGTHYSSTGEVPIVPGVDGVGTLEDGTRVYFGLVRKPWGTMAELAAVPRSALIPLPEGLDETHAAAIGNPGMSAWASIKDRAGLAAGETVLILGATGVAGQLAIQLARHLGAKRIVGAGRNVEALAGAGLDNIIALTESEDELRKAFAEEAVQGVDVVIDYLWGRPTEWLIEALAKNYHHDRSPSTRWVEVGSSAGPNITLPGAALRAIDLKLLGSGFGAVPIERIFTAISSIFAAAAAGAVTIDVDAVPLSDVEAAWGRGEKGKRIVFML